LQQLNKDIIEGLCQNSAKAMKCLFDCYYRPLCLYAARYVKSMPVAEEVVSDVMCKIWQNRHNAYRAETFREYLFAATRNTALNYWRQEQNRKQIADNWTDKLRDEIIEETPLDKMITKETILKINSLIEALPEQCRKAFMFSRMEGMTYDEIAAEMGISINTVKYHIKIALHKLRCETDSLFIFLLGFSTTLSYLLTVFNIVKNYVIN